MRVKIKREPGAELPAYSREGDAAVDLRFYSPRERATIKLAPGQTEAVPTGLYIELPKGYAAFILPRSGCALYGLTVGNAPGLIDSNYRGEIKVILHNNSDCTRTIEVGERVAQMIVREVEPIEWLEVDELSDSNRGANGFGSSGVK